RDLIVPGVQTCALPICVIGAGFTATAGAVATPYQAVLLPNDGLIMPVEHVLRDPVTRQVVIEGTGIEPTVRVPKTVESVLAAVRSEERRVGRGGRAGRG